MTVEITEFRVARDDIARATPVVRRVDLGEGDILCRVDRFALTANNITYAAHGEDMNYWDFYPAPDGFGIIPVWGFADVVETRCEGVMVGERFYGYWPMASHAVLQPARVGPRGFVDGAAHRVKLAAVYNSYQPAGPADGDERATALFRPLFLTSFLLADVYGDTPARFVLSSASSKTALGMAQALAARGIAVTGLTSARNAAFVGATGYYAAVVSYDDVGALDDKPAIYVDFAGDRALRRAVHAHFGDALVRSIVVGDTHVGQADAGGPLDGPRPEFFFAPTHLALRMKEGAPGGFLDRFARGWTAFLASTAPWLRFVEGDGIVAVSETYARVAAGRLDPAEGIILRL